MKRLIFILFTCLLVCSCKNEIEEPRNIQECAITYIENIILKNNIDYYKPNYSSNKLSVYLDDYDNYGKTYDFYNNDNFKKSSWRSNIRRKLENDLRLSLNSGDYKYTSGAIYVNKLGWCNCAEIYFISKMYNDEIKIIGNPQRTDYISIEIKCNHNHPNPQLK